MDHGVKNGRTTARLFTSSIRCAWRRWVMTISSDSAGYRHHSPSGKIQAIIGNARAYLAMEENGESFTDFVWSFVDNAPQVTALRRWRKFTDDAGSDALSKALKNAALSLSARQSVIPLCRPAGQRPCHRLLLSPWRSDDPGWD